jgi:membrane protein
MAIAMKDIVEIAKRLALQAARDDVLGLSAELAYRFFLAIFPFFIVLASLGVGASALFGVANPAQHFIELLGQVMPSAAVNTFQPEIEYVIGTVQGLPFSASALGALAMATSGTNAIIKGMNRAYGVEESRIFWQRYLLTVVLTLLAGTAIIGSFLLFVGGWVFGTRVMSALGLESVFEVVATLSYWPLISLLLTGAMSVLYRLGPNMKLNHAWISPGAVLFTGGWMVATSLLATYVDNLSSFRFTYGTLGGVVVLLLWFYWTGFVLLLGAELNDILDERRNRDSIERQRRQSRERVAQQLALVQPDERAASRSIA